MTIDKALEPMGLPCGHPPYSLEPASHIEYRLIGQTGQIYAEGREAETGTRWMISIFMLGYDSTVFLRAKTLLEGAGYVVTVEGESFDADMFYCVVELSAVKVGAEY